MIPVILPLQGIHPSHEQMMNLVIRFVTLVILTVVFAGCASTSNKQTDGDEAGTIPPDSKFAKISIGMPMEEVFDLIGPPTDTNVYTTGKIFTPFYFGSDVARSEALYKGEGRITFTFRGGRGAGGRGFKVYRIVYDPTETGYNK
jgi:hypothetical protein